MLKAPLTGSAQPVADSVQRAMAFLKDRPNPQEAGQPRQAGRAPGPGDTHWRPQGHRR